MSRLVGERACALASIHDKVLAQETVEDMGCCRSFPPERVSMTDTTATRVGPNERLTAAIGFLVALWASWGTDAPEGFLKEFAACVMFVILWPYAITKLMSKRNLFDGWLFLYLTGLGGAFLIAGEVISTRGNR